MIRLRQTPIFEDWQQSLIDPVAQYQVAERLTRLKHGSVGDSKSVGNGVLEMRIHSGPGYRIYYCWRGRELILLLCGGNKSRQSHDIALAKKLAKAIRDED